MRMIIENYTMKISKDLMGKIKQKCFIMLVVVWPLCYKKKIMKLMMKKSRIWDELEMSSVENFHGVSIL